MELKGLDGLEKKSMTFYIFVVVFLCFYSGEFHQDKE